MFYKLQLNYLKFEVKAKEMQPAEESASVNIMKNLQYLEQFTVDLTRESVNMTEACQVLRETVEWTYQTIFSEEIEIALQILDLLVVIDKVKCCEQKRDFDSLFPGSGIGLVVNYNTAACYQLYIFKLT